MAVTQTDSRIKIEKPTESALQSLEVERWPIWEKGPATVDWHYDDAETCFFLDGEVTVKTDRGEVSFGKGDLVTFPKGLSCTWQIKRSVRKHYRFG